MAVIPLGNFGNVMPQAQPGRVLDTGAGQVAQAIGNVAQVGQQYVNKELKIQEEKDQYQFNIEASKYGAEYQDYISETKQKLVTGELNEATAKIYLRQRTDELAQAYSTRIPEKQKERFNFYSEKMYNDSQAFIKPLAYETERRAINSDFEQVGEATLKIENREQALALYQDTVNRNPVLTPDQRKESVNKWNERRDLSDAKGVLGSLEEQADITALEELHKNVDTVFPHMKIETRDAYKANIESAIARLQKGQELKLKELDKEQGQLAKDFIADAFTGFPLSESLVNQTLEAVQGTKYEADVRDAIALNKDAQLFRNASPVEQERSIARLTTELENTPQEDATLLEKKLSVFKSIASTSKQRAKDDPVASVQAQTGVKLYTVTPEQIGSGNIDFKKAQLTTQMLADQYKANGNVGSLIQWNTTERKAFTDRYHASTPKQQRAMLTDLVKLAGDNKQAKKEYLSLVGGESNAYDYAGIVKLNELDIVLKGTNIRAAEVALEGKMILNSGQASVLGAEKEFHNAISNEFGNTAQLGSPEYRAYQNLSYSIYLGLAKRGEGSIKQDEKGNPIINRDLAKKAFEIATGGTYKQKLGKNTQTVFRVYGMTEEQFEENLEDTVIGGYWKETGTRISRSFLREHAIEQVPNAYGWYWFRNPDGSRHINPKTKKPYMVQITN